MISMFWLLGCLPDISKRNFPPTLEVLEPTKESFQENERINFRIISTDPEGGPVTLILQSSIDGIFFEGFPDNEGELNIHTPNLSNGEHDITVFTEDSTGLSRDHQLYLKVNGHPDGSQANIFPLDPTTMDDLQLTIEEGVDPEGDIISHSIIWKRNGAEIVELNNNQTVTSEQTSKGDLWQAIIIPSDGEGEGLSFTSSVQINDTPPIITNLQITPDTDVTTQTTLTCSADVTDLDQEEVEVSYSWKRVINEVVSELSTPGETLELNPAIVSPEEHYLCQVDAITNDGVSSTATTWVPVINSPPIIQNIEILSYEPIRAGASVFCDTDAIDPDGEPLTLSYEWRLNSTQILGLEYSLDLPDAGIEHDDIISCNVLATDNYGGSNNLTTSQVVENTPPEVISVNISPSYPTTVDPLLCTSIGTDIDSDDINFTYVWIKNGALLQESTSTLNTSLNVDDVISCQTTPNDGLEDGSQMTTEVTVINSPPVINLLTLEPTTVYSTTNLQAVISTSDVDGDGVSLIYEWYVDGAVVQQGTDDSLNGLNYFDFGQDIFVTATPFDGRVSGDPITSATLDVLNSAPTIENHQILSNDLFHLGSHLECSALIQDDDNDPLNISYSWQDNNGTILGTQYVIFLNTNNAPQFGDDITCTISVDDGTENNTSMVSEPIANSLSTIADITFSPQTATSNDSIQCIPQLADFDDQTLSSLFGWKINGITISESSDTLTYDLSPSDIVTCEVTPFDGIENGISSELSMAIINSEPEIISMVISPSIAFTNSTLNILPTSIDDDGDPISYMFNWKVDGVAVQLSSQTSFSSNQLLAGNEIIVQAIAYDGHEGSAPFISDPIIIQNAPPSPIQIHVNPQVSLPMTNDLICEIVTAPIDPDNDSLNYQITWSRNSVPWSGNNSITETTNYENDTIPAEVTESGDIWRCTVEVSDGNGNSVYDQSSSTIACGSYIGTIEECPAISCKQILMTNPSVQNQDGLYWLRPENDTYEAYCDMTHDQGGWTLVMRTMEDSNGGPFTFNDNFYWETDTLYNEDDPVPNAVVPTATEHSKYQSFSEVEADSMRLYVVWDAIDFNFTHDLMGNQTAMDLFIGPLLLVEGDVSVGCHGPLLEGLEFSSYFSLGMGQQFFGVNGNIESSNLRFGVLHSLEDSGSLGIKGIGIGGDLYSSIINLQIYTFGCGVYSSNYSSTEPYTMDLWVR
jgi:hypothetical protein